MAARYIIKGIDNNHAPTPFENTTPDNDRDVISVFTFILESDL